MKRLVAISFVAIGVISSNQAYAQTAGPGAGRVELSIIPARGFFFKESEEATEPGFKNVGVGGALAININRFVGIEGEVTGGLGRTQTVTGYGLSSDLKTPNLLNYSGNIVFSAANPTPIVPYFTAGVGGLSLLETTGLGIHETETFLRWQCRRRPEVVCRSLGPARRLPVHRHAVEGRGASVLRTRGAIRPSRLRRRDPEPGEVTFPSA